MVDIEMWFPNFLNLLLVDYITLKLIEILCLEELIVVVS